jgi:putative cell wall-binding protein
MKKSILIIFTMLLIIIIATSLFAQSTTPTITFNVPLQLAKLHQNVTEVTVQCVCNNYNNAVVSTTGRSSSARPDANGNINQTVTVTVQSLAGKDLSTATNYSCALGIKFVGVDGWGNPSTASTHVELQPKAGTTFVSQVYGTITW